MSREPAPRSSLDDDSDIAIHDHFAGDLDNSAIDRLYASMLHRKVVAIRNFGTEPQRLRDLARSLAQRATSSRQPFELRLEMTHEQHRWESDLSFLDHPPAFGVAGLVSPAHPLAHTRWVDTVRAYENLPPPMKDIAGDLRALHSGTGDSGRVAFQTTHPVVCIHPRTRQRALFLGQSAQRIIGLSKKDSDDVLDLLREQVMASANQFTVHWSKGDAIVWDNAATVHDTLDGFGARGRIVAFGFAGPLPVGIDGTPSRSRHGDPRVLAATAA